MLPSSNYSPYHLLSIATNYQPFTNTFQCISYRLQSEYRNYTYNQQHPVLSEFTSTFRAVHTYFFVPNPVSRRRFWYLTSSVILAQTLLESTLPSILLKRLLPVLFPTHPLLNTPVRSLHLKRRTDSINTLTNVLQLILCKSLIYPLIAVVSHPFSILRTIALVTDYLPQDTVMGNLEYVSISNPNQIYASSVLSHVASGLSSIVVGDLLLYYALEKYDDVVEGEDEPPANTVAAAAATGKLTEKGVNKLAWSVFLRAACSFLTRCLIYPLTLVQTRLEMQGVEGVGQGEMGRKYEGLVDCVKGVWERNGIVGFYRGFGAHALIFVGQGVWIGAMFLIARGAVRYGWFEGEEGEGTRVTGGRNRVAGNERKYSSV